MTNKTHRKVNNPQISARSLADYMASSEQKRRSIISGCKYQPIARIVQHDEAKLAITGFLRDPDRHTVTLLSKAEQLRTRLSDNDFDRDIFDHNADYIERFVSVIDSLNLPPDAEILPAGTSPHFMINGVKVTNEICVRLRRTTKSNKVKVGTAVLRYAKGKPLSPDVAAWHSAFMLKALTSLGLNEGEEAEQKLCITIDAWTGLCYPAPTDSVRRFNNMEAACLSIAERWPNIAPPPKAVF